MTSNARKIIEDAKVEAAVEQMVPEYLRSREGRCQALYRNGNECRAWAVADGLCRQHGEQDDARVQEIRAEGQRLAEEITRRNREKHSRDCTYRGFRITHRGISPSAEVWQVIAVSYESAKKYLAATGERRASASADMDCGIYEMPLESLKAQIDDVMGGMAPVEVQTEMPAGSGVAKVVSPRTGEVYAEISAEEQAERAEQNARVEALREAARVSLYGVGRYPFGGMSAAEIMAVVEIEREKRAAVQQEREERKAAETREREARTQAALAERKLSEERLRAEMEAEEREYRRNRRKALADLHQRQDVEGLQRTNLGGELLCDSCQRVYHDPDYDFCYGCKRGRKNTEHRQRVQSGEIKAREQARKQRRAAYLDTPEIQAAMRAEAEAKQLEKEQAKAAFQRERDTASEITRFITGHGYLNGAPGFFARHCERGQISPRHLPAFGAILDTAGQSLSGEAYTVLEPSLMALRKRLPAAIDAEVDEMLDGIPGIRMWTADGLRHYWEKGRPPYGVPPLEEGHWSLIESAIAALSPVTQAAIATWRK